MNLTKPLVVLDLETTGIWIEKDKIIEIALIRSMPDGSKEIYEKRVNPGMSIPKEAADITGIRDEDVKGAPFFKDIAQEVLDFIGEADLGGFNLERFDLPLLTREIQEANLQFEWQTRNVYDAQKIFHLHEKRDLTAAYKFYCSQELKDAHSALADSEATLAILVSQLERYGGGQEDIEVLQEFDYKQQPGFYDAQRKFRWWNGELYMMFGKYSRKATLKEVANKDPRYLQWILSQDFSEEVKDIVEAALEGHFPPYGFDKK